MSRSRSSFDLGRAIATATSFATPTPGAAVPRPFEGLDLVSFKRAQVPTLAPVDATAEARIPVSTRTLPPDPVRGTPPPPALATEDSLAETQAAEVPRPSVGPPRLPDLSAVVSPILRCEMIVDWIAEATDASSVFLADAAGLPLAGAIYEAEAILAGSGAVASSVLGLASAVPGSANPLFEMHVGDGPVFQLIGFQAGPSTYVVGFLRASPLSPRQAHAIRLACRHALGPTLESHT